MIKQAFILPTIGKAAFQKNDAWFLMDGYESNQIRAITHFDLNYFSLGQSTLVAPEAVHTEEELAASLAIEQKKHEALTLALQLMDPSVRKNSSKVSLAKLLQKYLREGSVNYFVETHLLSTLTPEGFVPEHAISICEEGSFPSLIALYKTLFNRQEAQSLFYTFWNKVAPAFFAGEKQLHHAWDLMFSQGLIKGFIQSLEEKNMKLWDQISIDSTLLLQQNEVQTNARLFTNLKEEIGKKLLPPSEREHPNEENSRDEIAEMLIDLVEGINKLRFRKKGRKFWRKDVRNWARRKRSRSRFKYHDGDVIIRNVDFYIEEITEANIKGRNQKVEAKLKQLIESQIETSNPQQICMTLCKLAKSGLERGNFPFSKRLLEYARLLDVDDPVLYCQNAEILKAEGKLSEAKVEYIRIKAQFPDDIVAQTGYAEILKAEGKLSEAKDEYLTIKAQFPNDIVAQTGYAEILKAEGKLSEAKVEYIRIKAQFPNNIVAQTGYAEILKAEGKLSEAKVEYIRIKAQFPNNIVAQNGYAEILKAEGKLSEAKDEYLTIKAQFPNDIVAQTGYAEILKAEGKLSEAKDEYIRIKEKFPNNIVAQTGYAEILKAEGKLSEAKDEYLTIKEKFPNNIVAQNGYAEILKAEGKLSEAKDEYLTIKAQFPNDIVAQNGYAEILKAEGKLSEAKDEYIRIKAQFPDDIVAQNGYAEILKAEGKLSEAKDEYLTIKAQFPNDIVAQNGYAEILKAEGKLSEAKDEYIRIKAQFPDDIVAQTGYAEILKAEGNLTDALQEYGRITEKYPFNEYAQHALVFVAFMLGQEQQFDDKRKKIEKPNTLSDHYWYHLEVLNLIRRGDLEEAMKKIKWVLNQTDILDSKNIYRRTLNYLRIQIKELDDLIDEVTQILNPGPVDHLLLTHAWAEKAEIGKARGALEQCKKYQEYPVVYETACLLSERFDLNGLRRIGLPVQKLDEEIKINEFKSLLTSI